MERRDRPVLVFDGDCGFCTSSVRFIERYIPADAEIVPFQTADLDALGTTRARAEREVLWVDRTGRVHGAAQAAARVLIAGGGMWAVLGRLMTIPPLSWLAAVVYRLVANNRQRMPGGTPACSIDPAGRDGRPYP